jgi:O-antigen ligase
VTARSDALGADRWVVYITAVASAVAVWRPAFDPFSLPKATVVVLGGSALVLLALMRWIRTGVVSLPSSRLAVAAGVFLVALALATLASDNLATSVAGHYKRYTGFVLYASCVALFFGVVRAFSAATVERLTLALLTAGALVIGYGVMQWVGVEPYDWQNLYGDAVFSWLGNPNFAGAYAGIITGPALWGLTRGDWPLWGRAGAGVLLLGCVAVAVKSDSFQGPVTVLVAGGVFAVGWLVYRGGRAVKVGVPALLGAAGVLVAFTLAGFAGSGPLARLNDQNTLQLRLYYWDAALSMFQENPITGVGTDRYVAYYRAERSQEAALNTVFSVSADEPHNVPLDMFAEGGLPLGLAYLAFVGLTGSLVVIGFIRVRGRQLLLLSGLAGAWAAYQVQSMVSIDVAPLAVVQWLLAGAIAVVVAPPAFRDIRLPWAPAPVVKGKGKGKASRRGTRQTSAARDWAAIVVASLLAVGALWFFTRPLRADIAFGESRSATVQQEKFALAERSTELAPWEPMYWFQAGVRRLDSGQEPRAMALMEEAIERDPRGLEQVVTGARIANTRGDIDRAAELYARALEIEPYAPEMVAEVARFKFAHDQAGEAAALAEYLTEVRPEIVDFWVLLGEARALDANEAEAAVAFRRALELSPDNEAAERGLEAVTR